MDQKMLVRIGPNLELRLEQCLYQHISGSIAYCSLVLKLAILWILMIFPKQSREYNEQCLYQRISGSITHSSLVLKLVIVGNRRGLGEICAFHLSYFQRLQF